MCQEGYDVGYKEGQMDMRRKMSGDGAFLQAENERLKAALEEIAKGEGPFSRDHKQHAINCIEHMVDLAAAALKAGE